MLPQPATRVQPSLQPHVGEACNPRVLQAALRLQRTFRSRRDWRAEMTKLRAVLCPNPNP